MYSVGPRSLSLRRLPSGWWLFLGQLLYLHQDNAFKAKSQTASEKQSKKQKKQALAVEKALRDMDNSDVVSARIMTADVVRLVYTGVDRKGSGAWAMCDDLDLMVSPMYEHGLGLAGGIVWWTGWLG